MNFRQRLICCFIFLVANIANAHVVTEVRAINQTIYAGETLQWEYDLAQYGFVPGRDTLGDAWLRVEVRDPHYRPDKEWFEQPFLVLYFGHRDYMRVGIEDWVASTSFYDRDNITPAIIADSEVWIGIATLTFEFKPGATAYIPEPSPVFLFVIGLLALGIFRHRKNFTQH